MYVVQRSTIRSSYQMYFLKDVLTRSIIYLSTLARSVIVLNIGLLEKEC